MAKAIGLRSQSLHRLLPTVGLRGIRARRERIIDLQYDDQFSGDYEIATPVEIDEAGVSSAFGLVPIDENRWTLLEGEEGDKPAPVIAVEYDDDLPLPANVTVISRLPRRITSTLGAWSTGLTRLRSSLAMRWPLSGR